MTIRLFGQVEYPALQSIRKGKWEKAYAQLHQAMRKDTTNIALSYGWATYFFSDNNPRYHLDSANLYARKALRDLVNLSARQRGKPKRFASDSLILTTLSTQIDSIAAVRARVDNSTGAYQHFIENFNNASQFSEIVTLRDESAYRDTQHLGTEQAYDHFIKSFPQAKQLAQAIVRYESLHYKSMTHDNRLVSFRRYLVENPTGHHRLEAEQEIFEILTADGSPDAYGSYLNSKDHPCEKRAQNILFHLSQPRETPYKWGDSLQNILDSPIRYLVPFLKNRKFGFMDQAGRAVINASEKALGENYLCGNITDDILISDGKIIALNGTVVYDKAVDDIEDIGSGFLIVNEKDCNKLIHKSGFEVSTPCFDNARIINGFIALRKSSKWSLYTLTGRMLMPYHWDIISSIGSVLVFIKDGNYKLMTPEEVATYAEGEKRLPNTDTEEIAGWKGQRIWTKQGDKESVLSYAMDTLLTVRNRSISETGFGAIVKDITGVQVFGKIGISSDTFQAVQPGKNFSIVKQAGRWFVYNPSKLIKVSHDFDTLSFIDRFLVGKRKDSVEFIFPGSAKIRFKGTVRYESVNGRDSSAFLLIESNGKKILYDQKGNKLFACPYDRVEYIGQHLFTVRKNSKSGVIDVKGKLIVPVEMDAIGSLQGNSISILKNAKFGLLNTTTRKLIPTQYSKNLTSYNQNLLVGFKNANYALVNWDNKSTNSMSFEEVKYWNDSSALIRRGGSWMIIDLRQENVLVDDIRQLTFVNDTPAEKLAIARVGSAYGVIHNSRGVLLPFSFTDIVNVGSPAEPLYFTEKHVEEASIYVVTYYESTGKAVRKEVYDQDEYERIYCPNH
ncbi:MAG: hypothetical protein ABIS36_16785 [Chryseolinea sp.]